VCKRMFFGFLRVCDPDWIIILFFIYITTFWVGKLEELACRAISAAGPNLENWVKTIVRNLSKPF
jgi:hypothetical protein